MRYLSIIFIILLTQNLAAQNSPLFARYIEGIDYQRLNPSVATSSPDKIEITEAFSYGCSHCYNFEPVLNRWKKTMASDVRLVKLPVIFQSNMKYFARIYYAAKELGVAEQVTEAAFKTIHVDKKRLNSEQQASVIFQTAGIEPAKFKKIFYSVTVLEQVDKASKTTREMKISGTPQMVVNGLYSVSVTRETGHEGMLQVVDFLIDKVRLENKD